MTNHAILHTPAGCTLAQTEGNRLLYTPFSTLDDLSDYCTRHEIAIPIDNCHDTLSDFRQKVLSKLNPQK